MIDVFAFVTFAEFLDDGEIGCVPIRLFEQAAFDGEFESGEMRTGEVITEIGGGERDVDGGRHFDAMRTAQVLGRTSILVNIRGEVKVSGASVENVSHATEGNFVWRA